MREESFSTMDIQEIDNNEVEAPFGKFKISKISSWYIWWSLGYFYECNFYS